MKNNLKAEKLLGAVVLACVMAGCAVGPGYEAPDFSNELGVELHEGNLDISSVQWWTQFADETLVQLICYSREHNPQLEAAEHRWAQSLLVAEQAGALRKPGLDATLSVTRQERSENGMFPVVDGLAGFPDRTETLAHGGLQLSWEVDLFGRLAGQVDVAEKGALMAAVSIEDTWRLLLSEVGRRYFQYMGLRAQLGFLEQQIAYSQEILAMDEKRLTLGAVPRSRVDADRVMLARLEALMPDLEHAMQLNLIQMSVLSTMDMEPLRELLALNKGKVTDTTLGDRFEGLSVDSQYLLDRPDVRIARLRFEQGLSQRKIAVGNLYPRLVLLGGLGLESIHSGELLDASSRFWNLGPAMTIPLFHAGQLKRQVDIENEEMMARLSEFEMVFRKAVGEVQVALSQLQSAMKAARSQGALVKSLEDQYRTVTVQYDNGLVADSERLQAEMELISAKADAIAKDANIRVSLVDLCQSVGGTWDVE